jgi:hypothetical protein
LLIGWFGDYRSLRFLCAYFGRRTFYLWDSKSTPYPLCPFDIQKTIMKEKKNVKIEKERGFKSVWSQKGI